MDTKTGSHLNMDIEHLLKKTKKHVQIVP